MIINVLVITEYTSAYGFIFCTARLGTYPNFVFISDAGASTRSQPERNLRRIDNTSDKCISIKISIFGDSKRYFKPTIAVNDERDAVLFLSECVVTSLNRLPKLSFTSSNSNAWKKIILIYIYLCKIKILCILENRQNTYSASKIFIIADFPPTQSSTWIQW